MKKTPHNKWTEQREKGTMNQICIVSKKIIILPIFRTLFLLASKGTDLSARSQRLFEADTHNVTYWKLLRSSKRWVK